jgi:hypothetical protein
LRLAVLLVLALSGCWEWESFHGRAAVDLASSDAGMSP